MPVNYVPDGHNVVTPILIVADADRLMDFMTQVLDAREHQVTRRPDGKIWHADVTIDGAHVMLSEASAQHVASTAAVNVYVPDVDATYARACAEGATSLMPPTDRFFGDRIAAVQDPCGVIWSLGTHVEDVAPDELKRREAEAIRELGQRA